MTSFGRSRARRPARRGAGRGRSPRRVITWDGNIFLGTTVNAGAITEFNLLTEAELAARSLGRGTVGMIYGRIVIGLPENETQGDVAGGAWGIRLKEADAPAGAAAAFSPLTDADSSDWITWRAFSISKISGAGTGGGGDPQSWSDDTFVIRNPRKIDNEEELVMLFENLGTSTANVNVFFWCRVMLILP